MSIISTAVIAGAGAVGLTVAERLFSFSADSVRIFAFGERLERYRCEGLWVNGSRIPFVFWTPGDAPADLIIFACKSIHLSQLIDEVRPCVGDHTLMLSLLNGINSEEEIGKVYGRQRLPLAMILGTDAQREGTRVRYRFPGTIYLGGGEGSGRACAEEIAEFFKKTGIAYCIPSDMKRKLWYKYMINTGINQCSAVLRLLYGPFQRKNGITEAQKLMEAAMREAMAVGRLQGVDLGEADIESWYKTLDSLPPESRTSMCQDVLAKRQTEAELFSGTIIRMADEAGIPVPVNRLLYSQLKIIENTYQWA